MLKKRIIPLQLLYRGRLVKSRAFGEFRDVGDPVKSSGVYNSQYADELVILNIDRQERTIAPLARLIEAISNVTFMPLSLGGGISSFEDAAFLIKKGADKVVINSAAYDQPDLLTRIADRFGAQAVIAAIDVRQGADGRYVCTSDCGRTPWPIALDDHVGRCAEAGAGEVLIQSIDRDGTMIGFDADLITRVMGQTGTPVIAAGGSGNYAQLKDAFLTTNVSA